MNSGAGYRCIAKAGCFATRKKYVGEQECQMCGYYQPCIKGAGICAICFHASGQMDCRGDACSEAMRTCQYRRECHPRRMPEPQRASSSVNASSAAAAEIPSTDSQVLREVEAMMTRMEELYTEVSGRLVVLEGTVTSLHDQVDMGQARVEKHVHDLHKEVSTNRARVVEMKEIQQKGNSDTTSSGGICTFAKLTVDSGQRGIGRYKTLGDPAEGQPRHDELGEDFNIC